MAEASPAPSLRKEIPMPNLYQSPESFSTRVEVLDNTGRPVCLLPAQAARSQGLKFHAVALQIIAASGELLLAVNSAGLYDPTYMRPVPAGLGIEEFACALQAICPGYAKEPRFIKELEPDGIFLFTAIYSASMLKAMAPASALLASRAEITQLQKQALLTPLLARLIDCLA